MASSNCSIPPVILRLHHADNVAVAIADLSAGLAVMLDDSQPLVPQCPVPAGHKIALKPIAAGEKILKWGCPIGSATRPIIAGEHVHTHNLKSDYLPTFTLDPGREFVQTRAGEP